MGCGFACSGINGWQVTLGTWRCMVDVCMYVYRYILRIPRDTHMNGLEVQW